MPLLPGIMLLQIYMSSLSTIREGIPTWYTFAIQSWVILNLLAGMCQKSYYLYTETKYCHWVTFVCQINLKQNCSVEWKSPMKFLLLKQWQGKISDEYKWLVEFNYSCLLEWLIDKFQITYLYFRLHEIGVNVVVLSSTDSNVNSDKASLKCLASR